MIFLEVLFKILVKVILLPLWLITVCAQWIGVFFAGIARVILGLLSSMFLLMAVLGGIYGGLTGQEILHFVVAAFAMFMIPQICFWLLARIVNLRVYLARKIRS